MSLKSVPLRRSYNPSHSAWDHFYTASPAEADNAARVFGYLTEAAPCNIFTQQYDGTVPLFRLYNGAVVDHFYTTDAAEKDRAIEKDGYAFEAVAGYVYYANHDATSFSRDGELEARPLYRMYSQKDKDHFYTSDAAERDRATTEGYVNEGVVGYAPRAA